MTAFYKELPPPARIAVQLFEPTLDEMDCDQDETQILLVYVKDEIGDGTLLLYNGLSFLSADVESPLYLLRGSTRWISYLLNETSRILEKTIEP